MENFNNSNNNCSLMNGWEKGSSTKSNGLNNGGENIENAANGLPTPHASTAINFSSNGSSTLETNEPSFKGLSLNGSSSKGKSSNGCSSSAINGALDTGRVPLSDEDSDDDYCVYTYKGDSRENQRMADLPSSFYQFDSSDNQSSDFSSNATEQGLPLSSNFGNALGRKRVPVSASNGIYNNRPNGIRDSPAPNVFSPDMDFLEMDFDPSGYADPDGDDEEDVPGLLPDDHNELRSTHLMNSERELLADKASTDSSAFHGTPIPSTSTSKNALSSSSVLRNIPVESVEPGDEPFDNLSNPGTSQSLELNNETGAETVLNNDASNAMHLDTLAVGGSNNLLGLGTTVSAVKNQIDSCVYSIQRDSQMSLRLVKSNTLPELASKPNTALIGESTNFRPTERSSSLFSSGPVFGNSDSSWPYRARINTSFEPATTTSEDLVELEVGRIMIWDVAEAQEIAISQIGTSACGATAILNVMRALKTETSPDYVNECVGTRLRDETADLPQYLFSRSDAGATHVDLISGMRRASNDLIYARFFSIKNNISVSAFNKWLLHWICKGAIPVVTRNLQVGSFSSPHEIPDAWHHQMVFGVSSDGLFLSNPLECIPISKLLPQLTSESVLLVKRQDILSRKGPGTDLRQLARHPDPRWNEMNVLGQVANLLLEEIPYYSENSAARRIRSSHIKIPAEYQAGVTLFILRESLCCQLLINSGEVST